MKLKPNMQGIPHIQWSCELPVVPIGRAAHVSQKALAEAVDELDGAIEKLLRYGHRPNACPVEVKLIRCKGKPPVLRARWLGLSSLGAKLSRLDGRFSRIGPEDL